MVWRHSLAGKPVVIYFTSNDWFAGAEGGSNCGNSRNSVWQSLHIRSRCQQGCVITLILSEGETNILRGRLQVQSLSKCIFHHFCNVNSLLHPEDSWGIFTSFSKCLDGPKTSTVVGLRLCFEKVCYGS